MSSQYSVISNDEWERMQRDIAQEQAYQVRSGQEIARLQRLEQERRQELSRIQEANRQAIGRAVDYIVVSFRNNMNQLSDGMQAQISTRSDSFADQINGIRSQAAQLSSRVAASGAAIESIAQQYNDAFQGVLGTIGHNRDGAAAYLSEMDRMLEQIQNLHPERFMPDDYSRLLTVRANTAGNIETGDYQSAIIASQTGILSASRTLAQLIAFNEQYDHLYTDVRSSLNSLQSRIDYFSSQDGVISVNVGSDPMEFDYDIGFWSHGVFDSIIAAVNSINERIERGAKAPMSLPDLEEISSRSRLTDEQLTRCDAEARRDFASAVAVENTVTRLHESLENRGWSLESSGRVDEDSRKPYTMTYEDGAGNTVSFVIAAGKDPDKPAFYCEAFAEDTPTANVIKDGIGAVLEEEGLQTQNTIRRNDCSSNVSPDSFINNITQETEQMEINRRNQVRGIVGL